jgi:hypothetical protein
MARILFSWRTPFIEKGFLWAKYRPTVLRAVRPAIIQCPAPRHPGPLTPGHTGRHRLRRPRRQHPPHPRMSKVPRPRREAAKAGREATSIPPGRPRRWIIPAMPALDMGRPAAAARAQVRRRATRSRPGIGSPISPGTWEATRPLPARRVRQRIEPDLRRPRAPSREAAPLRQALPARLPMRRFRRHPPTPG